MNDKIFLDTNILIYSYSNSEPQKQATARALIAESNSFISTQVLQELTNTITLKLKLNYADAVNALMSVVKIIIFTLIQTKLFYKPALLRNDIDFPL